MAREAYLIDMTPVIISVDAYYRHLPDYPTSTTSVMHYVLDFNPFSPKEWFHTPWSWWLDTVDADCDAPDKVQLAFELMAEEAYKHITEVLPGVDLEAKWFRASWPKPNLLQLELV